MALESDAKFEEILTCGFQNDEEFSNNFHQRTRKCQN